MNASDSSDGTPSRGGALMRRSGRGGAVFRMLAAGVALGSPVLAVPPWGTPIMQPGIAAGTCVVQTGQPPASSYTFGLMDFRNPPAALYGPNGPSSPLWLPAGYYDPAWNVENIGNVFGIAIDDDGDIYTAAHGLYSKTWSPYHHRYGNLGGGATSLAAAGTIYKIDRLTGAPSVFAVLPQQAMTLGAGFVSGPGIGNLAHDPAFDQLFATNLEDGRIYRIDSAGAIQQVFDPMGPDGGAPGMPPKNERLWGIEVLGSQVFYAVWNTGTAADPGKIRRVDLDGSGAILPSTDVEVLTVPFSPNAGLSYVGLFIPVSDIEASADGTRLLLAERTMKTETDSYNHGSRVHIAQLSGSTWTVTNTLETGNGWGRGEAYGGTDFGPENGSPEQVVWMSTADSATTAGPHGIQGTRPADFPPAGSPSIVSNSWRVPYDPSFTTSGPDLKGSGGDVEIMQPAGCAELSVRRVLCPEKPGQPFQVAISVTNLSPNTAAYAFWTPCPAASLPPGATTAQPSPSGVFPLTPALAPGASTVLDLTLPASFNDQTVCFRLTLLDKEGKECCTEKICVELPDCECAEILGQKVECEVQADGTLKYTVTLTIRNRTDFSPSPSTFAYATILPPAGFSPNPVPISPPIPPGGTGTVKTCFFGTPGMVCFTLGLHDASLDECCSLPDVWIRLPECPGGPTEPDKCALEERVACCPPGGVATVNFTVCNNSPAPRTYSWSAMGLSDPACSKVLSTSSFTPSSGTLGPVPPGGCLSVSIQIRCENFVPGDCAAFRICARHHPEAEPLCCEGQVYRPEPGAAGVKGEGGAGSGGAGIAPGGSAPITLHFENPGTSALDLPVVIRDAHGLLLFSTGGREGATDVLTTRVQVPAGGKVPLRLSTFRIDDGPSPPQFTQVLVATGTADPGAPLGPRPALSLPVLLLRPAARTLPVSGLLLVPGSEPHVLITLPTEAGARYRMQRTASLDQPWGSASCTSSQAEVGPDGVFTGTGGEVTCRVPCDLRQPQHFFRVIQLAR